MSAPFDELESVAVWHYDGRGGVRHAPTLVRQGDGFVLRDHSGETRPYIFADLEPHGVIGGRAEYGLRKRPGWRIMIAGDVPPGIAARLPGAKRYGGVIDRFGLWPAVIVFALVSAGIVWAVLSTPAMVARMIPRSWEARMGDLMVGDFGDRACRSEAGDAALQSLAGRLGMNGGYTRLHVVNVGIVNAVALPGGHVVVFRGLIDQAGGPDEVAGVLAHELGHVENRDVLESLVRQLGLSVLLGGLDGNVGGYTNALLSASYSRAAESRADGFAIDALRRARVSTGPTADFFKRLSAQEVKIAGAGTLINYLSTHPLSADRERRFRDAASPGAPALDAREWTALGTMCANAPKGDAFGW